MGIDACADIVELDVIVPVLDCTTDFNEVVDTVFDCSADDESDSIFDTEASVVNVGEAVAVAYILVVYKSVDTDDSEVDKVDVNDDCGVSLDAGVMVASVDCDPLELTDNEERGVAEARALLDEVEDIVDEPEVRLLNVLDIDVNMERETKGEAVSLRDSNGDIDNFAVTELENDSRGLPVPSEGDIVLIIDIPLDMEARLVDESRADNVCVPLIPEDSEDVLDITLVSEEVGVIEPIVDTRALLDDNVLVEGDEDIDMEDVVVRLTLPHAVKVFVAVMIGLVVDLIVGVITAVLNAVEDGEDVIIPVIVLKEEIDGVNVFCKDEVTDTVPEKVVIDERESLELIEGLLRPVALEVIESIGDDVIETVGKVVYE